MPAINGFHLFLETKPIDGVLWAISLAIFYPQCKFDHSHVSLALIFQSIFNVAHVTMVEVDKYKLFASATLLKVGLKKPNIFIVYN